MRVDPNYVRNLSQALNASQLTQQTLTQELSSGLSAANLGDNPVAGSQNVMFASSISQVDSYVQSATTEQARLQVTDSALGQVVSDVTSAISLAVSAGSGTLTAGDLASIASQVSGVRDNVLSLANTSYLGQHLFSGSKGNTQPFVLNTVTNPATTTYQGDAATQSITTPGGQNIQVSLAGTTVFTAPGADLLGSLNQLVSDLNAGNTSALVGDTSALSNALSNVSTQRSVLGSSLSQVNSTSSYASTQESEFEAQQSTLLSADPATVATGLSNAEVQNQALEAVMASLGKAQNLFDMIS